MNIVNFISIVIEKAKLKYLLIWSGFNPFGNKALFCGGFFKYTLHETLCMALVVSAFKLSHGCVGCSCCSPVRFIAILCSCGIAFISPK